MKKRRFGREFAVSKGEYPLVILENAFDDKSFAGLAMLPNRGREENHKT